MECYGDCLGDENGHKNSHLDKLWGWIGVLPERIVEGMVIAVFYGRFWGLRGRFMIRRAGCLLYKKWIVLTCWYLADVAKYQWASIWDTALEDRRQGRTLGNVYWVRLDLVNMTRALYRLIGRQPSVDGESWCSRERSRLICIIRCKMDNQYILLNLLNCRRDIV